MADDDGRRRSKRIRLQQRPLVADECSICMNPLVGAITTTPCDHRFHRACLDRWKRSGGYTCPLCRSIIDPGAVAAIEVAAAADAGAAAGYNPRLHVRDFPVIDRSAQADDDPARMLVPLRIDGAGGQQPPWSPGDNSYHRFNSIARWGVPIESASGDTTLHIWQIEVIDNYLLGGQLPAPDTNFDHNIDGNIYRNANGQRLDNLRDELHAENLIRRFLQGDEEAYHALIAQSAGKKTRRKRKVRKTKKYRR
jgi:hypothetical protein